MKCSSLNVTAVLLPTYTSNSKLQQPFPVGYIVSRAIYFVFAYGLRVHIHGTGLAHVMTWSGTVCTSCPRHGEQTVNKHGCCV